ncbi:MAG: hypothetical protein PVG30_00975 [Gammaproteobacteria bacterium]|jgi:hypothetical protein
MRTKSFEKLDSNIKPGHVYRRDMLVHLSSAVDRDLMILINRGVLAKAAAGIYYKPLGSRYGNLPPDEKELVKVFLRDNRFLFYSWNQYNTLGLGLTQLYNKAIVYNCKRHGVFILNGNSYDFRRPSRGFPRKLTPEFLLVDLVNNINELSEDEKQLKCNIKKHLGRFNIVKVTQYVKKYGKIATRKFFKEIMSEG